MLTDTQLAFIANSLGVATMILIVVYHYVAVNGDTQDTSEWAASTIGASMTLCENESNISHEERDNEEEEEEEETEDETMILPLDSRFSRLSFQSGDSKKSYRRRVSFDNTLDKAFLSYTLRTANEGYQSGTASRLFMVTLDDCDDVSGAAAVIGYAMNLVDTGDEVIVIGMHHHGDTPTPKHMATQLLNCTLDAQQHEDKISITVEVVFGKPEQILRSMVQMYDPTILIVGCRKKTRKSVLFTPNNNGMIHQSLKQAPVPVIFVQQHTLLEEPHQEQQQQQHQQQRQQRGHRRTLTALSSPLPETMSNDDFDASPSLSYRLVSSRNDRPSSLIASTNLASQLRRKFAMLKK
ncbi:hypothetical protein BDB00DRAFT_866933 [Zychaea mexicana]|uniref:uncharacterized protein n=1 Tax=Zychaea mexicana TaxID=64656 RepID=UPI0022FE59B2|nr:uncharacterized protein BDB00DRAFT_866933 [Zychaea mexicana]KAI9498862.1 hypothetical protein BDB00DRAFT_866933 [Zychaea mexicana]